MSRSIRSIFFLLRTAIIGMAFLWTHQSYAQSESDSTKLITIIKANEGAGQRDIDSRKLIGNVILRQDSVLIFCDSARLVANRVQADGHVIIQNDSVDVFARRAFYNGNTEKGFLYGDTVILSSGNQRLFAKDSLKYDLRNSIATYNAGAILIQDSTYIVSQLGNYYMDIDEVIFYNDVVVKDSAFVLVADSLKFNTTTRIVTFIAPTRITTDSSIIYTEGGTYSLLDRKGAFTKNPQFDNNLQRSTADIIQFDQNTGIIQLQGNAQVVGDDQYAEAKEIIYNTKTKDIEMIGEAYYQEGSNEVSGERVTYNEKTKEYKTTGRSRVNNPPMIIDADTLIFDNVSGFGKGSGNVIWRDTSEGSSIYTEKAEFLQEEDYFKAFGDRPLFASDIEGDTLFLSADTLLNERIIASDTMEMVLIDSIEQRDTLIKQKITLDTAQLLKAFYDVRIFKTNFQALCDSLIYNQKDSLFYLYKDPIVWSDTSQFVADTIKIAMKNDNIDRIYLIDNAFIINSPDEVLYNQVKGRKITAYFKEGEIEKMHVEGNAEAVYYALDDDNQYIGVNKTVSSEMTLFFEKNEITRIKFLSPDANLLPISTTDHEALKIAGFNWKLNERPKSKAAL